MDDFQKIMMTIDAAHRALDALRDYEVVMRSEQGARYRSALILARNALGGVLQHVYMLEDLLDEQWQEQRWNEFREWAKMPKEASLEDRAGV